MLPIDKLPTAPHPISLVTFGVLKTGAPFTQQGDTPMFKSFKSLLGLSLLAFFAVWMGCSSDSSPVAPYSASKTHDTSQTDPVTGAPATDTHIVDFGDNNLKYEVALEVIEPATRVPPKADIGTLSITAAEMRGLETLSAGGKGITSLRGLEYATNLKSLYLKVNLIEDVTPLADLTKLEVLNLETNRILDVSSLDGLNKLTSFRIGNNYREVAGVKQRMGSAGLKAAVAGMPNLTGLKANALGLTDISFLEDLPKLGYLNLNGNRGIISLKPLACLEVLADLRVQRINIAYNSVTRELHPLLLFLIGEGVSVDHGPRPS